VNATFYRPIDPHTAERWNRKAADRGFRFTAKAHRSWTHGQEPEPGTLEGLAPLKESGLLGALLLQFPQGFRRTRESFDRIDRLRDRAAGWPLVVEVRHVSWDADQAAAWMHERGLGWCVVDQPQADGETLPALARVTSGIGYYRLHGRNEADWFRPDAGRDARYDYLYGGDEMKAAAGIAKDLGRQAAEVYVIQNNHFRGKALANALMLRHLMGQQNPEAPATLIEAYPELKAIAVRTGQGTLF